MQHWEYSKCNMQLWHWSSKTPKIISNLTESIQNCRKYVHWAFSIHAKAQKQSATIAVRIKNSTRILHLWGHPELNQKSSESNVQLDRKNPKLQLQLWHWASKVHKWYETLAMSILNYRLPSAVEVCNLTEKKFANCTVSI